MPRYNQPRQLYYITQNTCLARCYFYTQKHIFYKE
nr:MAG TPA: hypothetical protein [Bacteriophage sp.]